MVKLALFDRTLGSSLMPWGSIGSLRENKSKRRISSDATHIAKIMNLTSDANRGESMDGVLYVDF